MARDLVSGGLFFIVSSLLAFSLASALPLWWFTTTELEGEMCSCGTGLWTGNVTWGNDLTQKNLKHGTILCSSESELMVEGCDANFAGQAESKAKGYVAGVFSILAVVLAAVSFGFGFSVLEKQPDIVDVVRFRKGLCWAALAALVAMFCEVTTISVFMSSPLFSNIGEDFGCHFVFKDPLNSNALKCHALGPSFGLAVGGCILCSFACTMFYLAFKNPHYIAPTTGRYSMFQEALLGQRPLDFQQMEDESEREPLRPLGTSTTLSAESQDIREFTLGSNQDEQRNGGTVPLLGGEVNGGRQKNCAKMICHGATKRMSLRQFLRLYWVPTVLLLNGAFFTWSNCSTGATVEPNVVISFPKEMAWLGHALFPGLVDKHGVVSFKDDVFNFTLITSLRHFWEGKAYGLAFLIGAFSGCWPYIKLFTMMFLWFVPSTEKLRGRLLHWLDVLGKWSLIDAYVLCLMAVAFGFNTDREILGINIHVDISVRPGWGVYSFVLATMVSLTLSHIMTTMHRNAIERRELTPEMKLAMERPPHETLSNRSYAPFVRRRRYACTNFGQFVMWFVLVATLAVTLSGQLLSTFEFRFSGLADLILPPEKRNTAYSLVSNGALLPEACSKGGFLSGGLFWSWFMTIMYFLFAMVIPLSMLVALAILWGVPMTLSTTKKVFHFCQIVQSWAALDVFLVSIIAAVVEIGGLSQAVIGDAFGDIQKELCSVIEKHPWLINQVLHMIGLPKLGPFELNDCALFRVDAVLMEGCWMLCSGVVTWAFCTHLIMEFADASIEERTRIIKVLASSDGADHAFGSPDPYELLRLAPMETVEPHSHHESHALRPYSTVESCDSNDEGDAIARDEDGNTHVQSVYLKKILHAQEEGARRFMGTYFCDDCLNMYGPFPRSWWKRLPFFRKVEWNKVGLDVHASLLMNVLSQNRRSSVSAVSTRRSPSNPRDREGEDWEPRSPAYVMESLER